MSVDAVSPFAPSLTLNAHGPLGINVYGVATDDWNLISCTVDYGDGSTKITKITSSVTDCEQSYTCSSAGTYNVAVTLTDAGGNQKTVSQSFITGGSNFTPVVPKRILDTRNATGTASTTPVTANGVVQLKIAGVDGLPSSGVTAVAFLANESSGTTHVIADLDGFYSAGGSSGYNSVAQTRLLDTRTAKTPIQADISV